MRLVLGIGDTHVLKREDGQVLIQAKEQDGGEDETTGIERDRCRDREDVLF